MNYNKQPQYLLEAYESYFESCNEGEEVLSYKEWLESIS